MVMVMGRGEGDHGDIDGEYGDNRVLMVIVMTYVVLVIMC